jgi:hypothetical protein
MNTAAARRIALATLVALVEMMTGWPVKLLDDRVVARSP